MNEDGLWWRIGIILILILLQSIVTAAEAAMRLINEGSIRKKAEEQNRRATRILYYKNRIDGRLSIFRVFLSGTGVVIGALFAVRLLSDLKEYDSGWQGGILLAASAFLLLFLVILFGSILPEKLARLNPEHILYRTIKPVWIITCICRPLIFLLNGVTRLLLFIFRINSVEAFESVTEEEIISMVNEGHERGVLEESEVEMISNIIEFDEKEVRDIMTHRKRIVGISRELTLEEAINRMLKEGYSRCPLYDEDIDNIEGILHLKDMMKCYLSHRDKGRGISLKTIAREPYFIPDTQDIDMLFRNMQLKKVHMAVAVDEYGQTAGIVAMEDIIEEIVGNIFDEYDVIERQVIKQNEGRYLMQGTAPLEEVEEALGIEMAHDEFDTLNGFLISLLGHIPDIKERVNISYMGYHFHVVDVKNKMIGYVRVTKEKN